MSTAINFKIGDWVPMTSAPWTKKGYVIIQSLDIFDLTDRLLEEQEVPGTTTSAIKASYTSYVAQVLKDIDYTVQALRSDQFDSVGKILTYAIDSPFTLRQPWRFTGSVLTYLISECELEKLSKGDPAELCKKIQPLLIQALKSESLMTVAKYIPTAHVILDYAFDAGWHEKFERCSDIKIIEGLDVNVPKGLELREVALEMSRSFQGRGMKGAAIKALMLGFIDIPKVINALTDEEIHDLMNLSQKDAMRALLKAGVEHQKTGSYNNIVSAVMRILSPEVDIAT